ncbi:MAG: ion transporter [Microscillaceae bacterium]|nr:ion transporter [Microscillaceae bacterium]MDW8459585.1 ion transporter [Cytophagales bacterium]
MKPWQKHLVLLFEQNPQTPTIYKRIDTAIYLLILLSGAGVILETLPYVKANPRLLSLLHNFENIAMTIFITEVLLLFSVIHILYKNCQTSWERFMLFFYLLIDIAAILPAILFALGSEHHDAFLTLRLLRLFKIFRHDDSVEIVLRAVIVKKDILLKTALIILISTIFLAVLLYEAENKFEFEFNQVDSQEEKTKFTDLWTALVWCFSMFVGDLAGFMESGFYPITPLGKVIAGIIGFLNVAIVIIPTGIIASGFLEVLEEKKIDKHYEILKEAFRPKYNAALQIEIHERPRTLLTLQNALYLHENVIFRILETKPGFRMRAVQSDADEKYGDVNLVEYYGYGTLTNYGVKRVFTNSDKIIICPDSFAHKGIGYFSYAVSELQQTSLVSNELFQTNSLSQAYDASFWQNPLYKQEITLPRERKLLKKIPKSTIALHDFKRDISQIAQEKRVKIFVFTSESIETDYQILPIQKLSDTASSDLLAWLITLSREILWVKISAKRLDSYLFYDTIKEVAVALNHLR